MKKNILIGLLIMACGLPSMASAQKYRRVDCLNDASAVIDTKGNLYVTGNPGQGRLGDGMWPPVGNESGTPSFRPLWTQTARNAQSIALGEEFSLYLSRKGRLFATGVNTYGRLGDGTTNNLTEWKKVGPRGVTFFGSGKNNTYVGLLDDSVWVVGQSELGSIFDSTGQIFYSTAWNQTGQDFTKVIGMDLNVAMALSKDNVLYAIQYPSGDVPAQMPLTWTPVYTNVRDFHGTDPSHVFVITTGGELVALSFTEQVDTSPSDSTDTSTQADTTQTTVFSPFPKNKTSLAKGVVKVKANSASVGYTDQKKTLYFINMASSSGQEENAVPTAAKINENIVDFCFGEHHALAIKANGSLWGAGINNAGELGYRPGTSSSSYATWMKLKTPSPRKDLSKKSLAGNDDTKGNCSSDNSTPPPDSMKNILPGAGGNGSLAGKDLGSLFKNNSGSTCKTTGTGG